MTTDFHTVKSFSVKLNISTRSVYRMIESGRINAFRAGPCKQSPYRIPDSEILRMATLDFQSYVQDHSD